MTTLDALIIGIVAGAPALLWIMVMLTARRTGK